MTYECVPFDYLFILIKRGFANDIIRIKNNFEFYFYFTCGNWPKTRCSILVKLVMIFLNPNVYQSVGCLQMKKAQSATQSQPSLPPIAQPEPVVEQPAQPQLPAVDAGNEPVLSPDSVKSRTKSMTEQLEVSNIT